MEQRISPVPREARPYQGQSAGLVTRIIANVVDALAVGATIVIAYAGYNALRFMIDPRGFQLTRVSGVACVTTALIALLVYFTLAWSITGRTYGDHVMGLRVVGPRGGRVRPPAAVVRAVFCVGFPVGLLWCAISSSRRSLQDTVLRTSVIYDWRPRQHPGDPVIVT